MTALWILPAAASMAAAVALVVALRALGREAAELRRSIDRLARLGVAADDIRHDAEGIRAMLARRPHR